MALQKSRNSLYLVGGAALVTIVAFVMVVILFILPQQREFNNEAETNSTAEITASSSSTKVAQNLQPGSTVELGSADYYIVERGLRKGVVDKYPLYNAYNQKCPYYNSFSSPMFASYDKDWQPSSDKEKLLIARNQNGLYGVIDYEGNWVLPQVYNSLVMLEGGLLDARVGSRYGLIELSGHWVWSDLDYEQLDD